jgi:hypothetical protein
MDVGQIATDFVYLYREFSPLNYCYVYIIAWEMGLIHNLLFKVVEEQEHRY